MQIVSRAGWGARAPAYTITQTSWAARTGFVVHYSAAPKTQTVRAIQDYHIGRGWGDIGYNWLVTVDGRIWEGRSGTWNAIGAHVAGHNTANIGVCMIGTDADVTAAAKASIRWLYEQAVRLSGKTLAMRYHSGMSGAATSCPGNNLRGWVTAGMPTPTGGTMADDYGSYGRPTHIGNRTTPVMIADLWAQSLLGFSPYDGRTPSRRTWQLDRIEQKLDLIAAKVDIDPTKLAAVTEAARAGAEAGVLTAADDLVAAILAGLPDGVLTRADVEAAATTAVRTVFGSLDEGTG